MGDTELIRGLAALVVLFGTPTSVAAFLAQHYARKAFMKLETIPDKDNLEPLADHSWAAGVDMDRLKLRQFLHDYERAKSQHWPESGEPQTNPGRG
jgi:hypothetical protein